MTRLRLRGLAGLALLAVLAAALALWHSLASVAPDSGSGQLLLPGLAAHVADVAAIEVIAQGKDSTVKRAGVAWILPAKDDYPAAPGKVAALLDRLAGLRLIEKKTADPARYAALGLGQADEKNPVTREVKLFNAAGESLGDVILGKPNPSMGRLGGGVYVRLADTKLGDGPAWLVEGVVDVPSTDIAFADGAIFPLADPQTIVSATAIDKGAALFTVTRAKEGKDLILKPAKGAPDQAKLLQFIAAPALLGFEDVRRLQAHESPARLIVYQLQDGTKDTLALYPRGRDLWVAASESGAGAAAFNAAHQGYAYRLPDYRAAVLMNAPADFAAAKSGKKP
jgi:hypothetical protein